MAENLKLKLILEANDKLSKVVKSAVTASDKEFEKLQKKLKNCSESFNNFGKKSLSLGAGLTASSGLAVKFAADFQSSMTNVSTLIDTNTENLDDMGAEVLKIGRRTPVAMGELTEGLYNIRSAGMEASEQFKILEKSAQLGVAGLGSTNEAIDLVTSSINAWQLKGKEAEKVYDLIFRTVKTGKTNISGIAQGFGAVAGTVAAAGIQLDDYLASVAALTTTGQPAAQAHTQIRAAISGMTRESKEAKAIFHQLGAKNFKDLVQKSGGMVNAFSKITKAVKGNDALILKLFGSTQAYNAVVGLSTNQNQAYLETLRGMRDGTNAVNEAFEKQAAKFNSVLMQYRNSMQSIGIEFGNGLLPFATKLVKGLNLIADKISAMPQPLKSALALGVAGSGLLLTGLGTVSIFIGASINGFSKMLDAYRKFSVFTWAHGIKLNTIHFNLKNSINGVYNGIKLGLNSIRTEFINLIPAINTGILHIHTFFKTAPYYAFNAIKNGLDGIKNGFINFIPNCRKAITAIRTFNIACSINPVGLLVTGIVAGGFLIYKYWKPISIFFKSFFKGLKEGLAPLAPMFSGITSAIQPIVTGIKKFFTPINTEGKKALEWGEKFGKAIGDLVVKLSKAVEWAKKLAFWRKKGGDASVENSDVNTNGSHANGLERVPFDGYIAKLHKNETVLTARDAKNYRKAKKLQSNNISLTYSPIINISGSSSENKTEFMQELKRHKREIMQMLTSMQYREGVRAYA